MYQPIYLDYNATTPVKPDVRNAMTEALAMPSNASSIHRFGQEARRKIEQARGEVATLIGAKPGEILFTSGATEANNATMRNLGVERILISAIEHPSIREAAEAETIPVDRSGRVDLDALARMLADNRRRTLVSIMLVNNETGVIQPIAEAAKIVRARGALMHSDAAQAPGRIAIDVNALGVDLLTLAGHKMGGPQGIGALYIRDGLDIVPLQRGGGQESRRRAGTENVASIVGFGVAARLAADSLRDAPRLAALRDTMEARLASLCNTLAIYGADAPRVCNTACFGAAGLSAETLLIALDLAGIAISSGAACSSGAVQPSRILRAMGVEENAAREAIRVSLGWGTVPEDIDRLVESWGMVYRRTRSAASAA